MLYTNRIESASSDRVIFAPEGFIDKRYLSLLKSDNIRIIELRSLADGPVFHTIHRNPINS